MTRQEILEDICARSSRLHDRLRTSALFVAMTEMLKRPATSSTVKNWARQHPAEWAEVAAFATFGKPLTPLTGLSAQLQRFILVFGVASDWLRAEQN